MCIFTSEIDFVSSTRIFSRIQENRQVVVYDMFLSSESDTAMVLPIPIDQENRQSVEFVDLSDYPTFFGELQDLFPKLRTRGIAAAAVGSPEYLEVEQVGAFEASFVPTQSDFKILDPRFQLSMNILECLPQYHDYAFVVFKLRSGESQIHPMAFWFFTRETNKLYYPTVHVHDGRVHENEEFNHVIYGQGKVVDHPGLNCTTKISGSAVLKNISSKSKGAASDDSEVYRQTLVGNLPNKDIWFDLY